MNGEKRERAGPIETFQGRNRVVVRVGGVGAEMEKIKERLHDALPFGGTGFEVAKDALKVVWVRSHEVYHYRQQKESDRACGHPMGARRDLPRPFRFVGARLSEPENASPVSEKRKRPDKKRHDRVTVHQETTGQRHQRQFFYFARCDRCGRDDETEKRKDQQTRRPDAKQAEMARNKIVKFADGAEVPRGQEKRESEKPAPAFS